MLSALENVLDFFPNLFWLTEHQLMLTLLYKTRGICLPFIYILSSCIMYI